MQNQVFEIGSLSIIRVLELEFPLGPAILPIGTDPEKLVGACGWAKPHFVTDEGDVVFALSTHCVVSEGRKIVIDPCCSFDLRRDNPDMPDRARGLLDEQLPAAGFAPDDVDLVLHTHIDGVGWNVRPSGGGWVPSFPKARNLWTQLELDRVLKHDGSSPASAGDAKSLAPLVEAGAPMGVDPSYRVTDEISFQPSPGHSRGNVEIWLESLGECAVIVGDHILNPIQCADPDWTGLDEMPEDSPRIRRALLEQCAERDALVIGPHFGTPGAGRVRRDGDVWRLEPVGN